MKTAKNIQTKINNLTQDYENIANQLATFQKKQEKGDRDFNNEISSYQGILETLKQEIVVLIR